MIIWYKIIKSFFEAYLIYDWQRSGKSGRFFRFNRRITERLRSKSSLFSGSGFFPVLVPVFPGSTVPRVSGRLVRFSSCPVERKTGCPSLLTNIFISGHNFIFLGKILNFWTNFHVFFRFQCCSQHRIKCFWRIRNKWLAPLGATISSPNTMIYYVIIIVKSPRYVTPFGQ